MQTNTKNGIIEKIGNYMVKIGNMEKIEKWE